MSAPGSAPPTPGVSLDTIQVAGPVNAEISGQERLRFARQVLCTLALFCVFILVGYGFNPANDAFKAMFEPVKIGALPVLTLMLSFYFPHAHRHEK